MAKRLFEGAHHASLYAQFRPRPPSKLAERIVQYLKEKYEGDLNLCLDVGCGSGQASDLFSPYFGRVVATDVSPAQIEAANSLTHPPNVEFHVKSAEECPVEDSSVQLVNSTLAVHWFDLPAFFKEADRVLCQNGVIALAAFFTPVLVHPDKAPDFQRALNTFRQARLGSYWQANLKLIENEYADIDLPFKDIVRDEVWTNEETFTLAGFAAYLSSWSAFQALCRDKGESAGKEILQEFVQSCQTILETNEEPEKVEIKLKRKYFLVMGRKY